MAAFCDCCGAEIKLKAEACPVCGTPRHGMARPDRLYELSLGAAFSELEASPGQQAAQGPFCCWR